MSEQQLVNAAKNYLMIKGCFVWRNNSGVTRSTYTDKRGVRRDRMWRSGVRGGADIIGITKTGQFIAIECKIGRNKPTDIQNAFLHEIESRGGITGVIYSLEDLQKIC